MNYLYLVHDSNCKYHVTSSRKSELRVKRMIAAEFFANYKDCIEDMDEMGTRVLYLGETPNPIGIKEARPGSLFAPQVVR